MHGMMAGVTTLAEFLRARREHVQPADVGLPDSGRRRTPGLRREEVATLAGVSVDYVVRLEQGRDTRPSPAVVRALADALRLADHERQGLWELATIGDSAQLCAAASRARAHEVAPTVTALLGQLSPTPGFVLGPSNDVLAWNGAWERLVTPLGMFEGPVPNLARHVFLHPHARDIYPDWVAAADEQVDRLRTATARRGDDDGFATLMDELRSSPDFVTRWSAYGAGERRRGMRRLVHPEIGELRLAYEVLLLPDDDEQRLVTWLPGDEATAAAFTAAADSAVPTSPASSADQPPDGWTGPRVALPRVAPVPAATVLRETMSASRLRRWSRGRRARVPGAAAGGPGLHGRAGTGGVLPAAAGHAVPPG